MKLIDVIPVMNNHVQYCEYYAHKRKWLLGQMFEIHIPEKLNALSASKK